MKKDRLRALPVEWTTMGRVFEALGDEQRQRLLLSFDPGESLNVSQLVNGSRLSRTTVSHHLKVLHGAGLLQREKRGKEVFYTPDAPFLLAVLRRVSEYAEGMASPHPNVSSRRLPVGPRSPSDDSGDLP